MNENQFNAEFRLECGGTVRVYGSGQYGFDLSLSSGGYSQTHASVKLTDGELERLQTLIATARDVLR
jgi:hypothetical protein